MSFSDFTWSSASLRSFRLSMRSLIGLMSSTSRFESSKPALLALLILLKSGFFSARSPVRPPPPPGRWAKRSAGAATSAAKRILDVRMNRLPSRGNAGGNFRSLNDALWTAPRPDDEHPAPRVVALILERRLRAASVVLERLDLRRRDRLQIEQ